MERISREQYVDYFIKYTSTQDLRTLCMSYQTAKERQPLLFKELFSHFSKDIWRVVAEELYFSPSSTITTKELGYMVATFKDAIEEVLEEVQVMPKIRTETVIQKALDKHIQYASWDKNEEHYKALLQQYNIHIDASLDEIRAEKFGPYNKQRSGPKRVKKENNTVSVPAPSINVTMKMEQERRVLRALPILPLQEADIETFPQLDNMVLTDAIRTYITDDSCRFFNEDAIQDYDLVHICGERVMKRFSTIIQLMSFAAQMTYTEEGRSYRHQLEDEKKHLKQLVIQSLQQAVIIQRISHGQSVESWYPLVMPMMLETYLPGTYARYLEAPQAYIPLALYVVQEMVHMKGLDMEVVLRSQACAISAGKNIVVPEILEIGKYMDCILQHIPHSSLYVPDAYFLCTWNDIQQRLPTHPVFTAIEKKMRAKIGTSYACDIRDICEVLAEVLL